MRLVAKSLAKVTAGIADNLLLFTVRAWDTTEDMEGSSKKHIVLAATNMAIRKNPLTNKQINVLEDEWGIDEERYGWMKVIRPLVKTLGCGDAAFGAMREWE